MMSITVFCWHDCKSVSVSKIPAWNGFSLIYYLEAVAWSCTTFPLKSLTLSARCCSGVAASWLSLNMDKTGLMWTDTKHNVSKIPACCHSLTLGDAQVVQSDAVHVLGVLLTPGLSLDKHVTAVSGDSAPNASFSFDSCAASDAVSTTNRPLLSSRRLSPAGSTIVAVCWSVRQRRQPTSCSVFSVLRPESSPIHASTIKEWVSSGDASFTGCMLMTRFGSEFVSTVQVYRCLHNLAPGYLSTLCQPVSSVPGHHLRWARRGELNFSNVNLATYEGWAFAYAGPTSWNSLPDSLKDWTSLCKPSNTILRPHFPHTSTFQHVWGLLQRCAI